MLKYYPEMAEFMTDNKDDSENDNDSENTNNKTKSKEYVHSDSTVMMMASDRSNSNWFYLMYFFLSYNFHLCKG